MSVKPFELNQAQDLIKDAVLRSDKRHNFWRQMEILYRTGSLVQARSFKAGELGAFLPDLDEHVANLVLPHVNIILESVIARDPKLIVEPLGGGQTAEYNRETSEGVISYFWRRAYATQQLRDATADMVRLGSGFVKVAWTHLEDEEKFDDDAILGLAEAQYDLEMSRASRSGMPYEGDIELLKGSVPHSSVRVIQNEPFVEYVSPYDVFVPVNARRIDEARWVAQRVTLPVDEILANPEFDVDEETLVRDGIYSNVGDEYQAEWRRQTEDARGIEGSSLAIDTATIWEFYDMRTREMMVFQVQGAKPLYKGKIPWSHRYPPFVHVRNYTSDGNDFWGFGDIENVANLQDMFNEFLTEQLENARRSGQKYLVRKSSVSDELIAALESSESDIVAPVNVPSGEPLGDIIVPVFRQALSGDIYGAKVELEDKIRQVLGINDFQAGGVGADRMSATAAAVVDGVATLRAQSKIASVETASAQIGNVILLLCQEYLDQPTAIRVTSISSAEWTPVSKQDIYGEFMVTIEGGSTRSLNPATREQQGLRTLGEVVPALVALGYNPEPALRLALRDLGYDPDVILIPMQAPAPMPAGPEGAAPGAPSNGEQMMNFGGPPAPAEAQARGSIAL
jgi:hypothetical protein